MILLLYYRISDESSLGILRCTIFFTKFDHLYRGTGCVCFFGREGGGGGGEHPLGTGTRRVINI